MITCNNLHELAFHLTSQGGAHLLLHIGTLVYKSVVFLYYYFILLSHSANILNTELLVKVLFDIKTGNIQVRNFTEEKRK